MIGQNHHIVLGDIASMTRKKARPHSIMASSKAKITGDIRIANRVFIV